MLVAGAGPVTMGGQGKGTERGPARCAPVLVVPVGDRGHSSRQGGAGSLLDGLHYQGADQVMAVVVSGSCVTAGHQGQAVPRGEEPV